MDDGRNEGEWRKKKGHKKMSLICFDIWKDDSPHLRLTFEM